MTGPRAILLNALLILLPLVLFGCGYTPPRPDPLPSPPALSVSDILAPVPGASELRYYAETNPSAATQLRRAYIFLETDHPDRAIDTLNRLLFGNNKPSARALAFAHYLQGVAYAAKNDTERSARERDQGLRYPGNPELRVLLKKLGNPTKPSPSVAVTPKPKPRITAPAILARTQWVAAKPHDSRMTSLGKVHRITVHHSGVISLPGPKSTNAKLVQAMQGYHMKHKGWADIGYHYVLDASGRVWTGRSLQWQGAHAGSATLNRGNIGICLTGKFTKESSGQRPSKDQLKSLESLLAWLCQRHGIPVSSIHTHRELHATTCPGVHLQTAVEKFRLRPSTSTTGEGSRQ